jgi:glycosyltransferase involved in cell wall biosynthesis
VTFTIVGADATEEVQRLAGPGVVVTGTVPDVRRYVARAAAVVVPLRMGSGTRLKVLEGLAMGKALVSTSLGCEGIDVRDGEHLLIADDPRDFAAAVLRLLDDSGAAAALGQRGRALAVAQYSWATVVEGLEGFYTDMLSRAGVQYAPGWPGATTGATSAAAPQWRTPPSRAGGGNGRHAPGVVS